MANPPFNVDKIDKTKLEDDLRFPFGLPRADNGNYIWIQTFYSALNANGRAGFVMANSASDARSELEIRRKLIEDRSVDVIIAVGSNMFYTVTLPVTLWFLDRSKKHTDRADQVLFIDARETYTQIDRAHRDWTPQQVEFLANIVRLWRNDDTYEDVAGLCCAASIEQIEEQGWSLNPGRYVGVASAQLEEETFVASFTELHREFVSLNGAADALATQVSEIGRAITEDG